MGVEQSALQKDKSGRDETQFARALYDFEGQRDDELTFKAGTKLLVLEPPDGDWIRCQALLTGADGFVPANYVRLIPTERFSQAPWYHGTISKGAANAIMKFADVGSFLVRDSLKDEDSYVIVAKTDSADKPVCNYKITRNEYARFYTDKNKTFKKLEDLVSYYKTHDGLKVRLSRPLDKGKVSEREDDVWEVEASDVQKEHLLGQGNFGEVYKGKMRLRKGGHRVVAVKTLKQMTMSKEKFLAEAEVMKSLRHQNVVLLLAICNDDSDMFIVTEFMDKGDLLKVLRSPEGGQLDASDLLAICHQICLGMVYLEAREFVHRDLAARNVLISTGNVVKLADFGLAKVLQNEADYYTGNEQTNFPVRWTAPEAIEKLKFSVKSDVWSFGITCCEVYTRGKTPYLGMKNPQVLAFLRTGERIDQPDLMPDGIYRMVKTCWDILPEKRPSFDHMEAYFRENDYKK